jgi:hypothetical protein
VGAALGELAVLGTEIGPVFAAGVFDDEASPPWHAAAKEPRVARLAAPPRKRRRDQGCGVLSVTVLQTLFRQK